MKTSDATCTDFIQVEEVFEYVFDAGIIRDFDEVKAKNFIEQAAGHWTFGCSTCCKVTSNGSMLVGRNMDLCFSHRPVYIISTEEKNCYKTKAISHYALEPFPTYDSIKNIGIPKDIYNVLPYIATDSINSEGLYIEVNMRNEEKNFAGNEIFGCSGTHPDSAERLNVLSLPTYLTQRCRNVDEALALVEKLDVYTTKADFFEWPLCCTMADADGHYGVLEFGMNKAVWNALAPCQTNFYLNSEMNALEKYKTGLGRYDILKAELSHIGSKEYLWKLMNRLTYSQIYDLENSSFDTRTEFVNPGTKYSTDYVLNEENRTEMNAVIKQASLLYKGKTTAQLRDESQSWYSMYTIVTDCNKRTMEVRFFEDDKYKTVISLENSVKKPDSPFISKIKSHFNTIEKRLLLSVVPFVISLFIQCIISLAMEKQISSFVCANVLGFFYYPLTFAVLFLFLDSQLGVLAAIIYWPIMIAALISWLRKQSFTGFIIYSILIIEPSFFIINFFISSMGI